MASELTDILLKAQRVDGSDRKHAEESLKQFEEKNPSEFLLSLSAELANDKKPVDSRKLAGLVLKNSLDAKDGGRRYELKQRWLILDVGVKQKIKTYLLQTLTSSADEARSTASQVIAKVARIELSPKQWPNLYDSLFPSSHQVPPHVSFETLGYLCEEVLPYALKEDVVNKILTHIVQGMNASEASNGVRLAATRALYKALGLAEENFTDDIIKAVCEVSSDVKIRQAAFRCLVFISSSDYEKLGTFVEEILEITCIAVKEDEEPVALQAIEIWSSICNEEMGYLDDYIFTHTPCLHLIKKALPKLVPMLLETIVKQDGACAWNVAMAGRRCLGLVARTVGNDIGPLVMPFIGENITKPEWRKREAATYAFGSILEGLSPNQLAQHLSWMLTALAEDPNKHVKDTTAWTLGRISKCLQVIAKVSGIELPPQEQWPELIGSLLPTSHVSLKTLGYLCEEVSSTYGLEEDEVNKILTAIVQCMDASEASNVRLAATRALYNALGFPHQIFTDDIMKAVCEATSDVKIQQAAFECLVSISSRYDTKLGPYMEKILEITCTAVKEYEEPVALQAIEIWISIFNGEMDYFKIQCHNSTHYFNCIKKTLPKLVPMLLGTIVKKQEEDQDGACAWNVAMAGRRCFDLVAQTVGNDIIPLVMPFIGDNITKSDWRQKEAAAYAFSSILEVPSTKLLVQHVKVPLSLMLTALAEDPNNHVKDTTAWTLGRIFQRLHGLIWETPIVDSANSQQIIRVLLASMKKDPPNVAENACWALYHLAEGFPQSSNPMTSNFEIIVQSLLKVTHREDADLRSAACETLKLVVWCSTEEKAFQLLPTIKRELHKTLKEQKKQNEMPKLLCGCLYAIIHRLADSSWALMQHANDIMNLLLRVLACPSAAAHEEAMLAVRTLACAMGPHFEKHMPDFYYKYLEKRLRNLKNDQECVFTLRELGFIFYALNENGLTWSLHIMPKLLQHYKSDQVDPAVKPLILSCFRDIAFGIGDEFRMYFPQKDFSFA